MPRVKLTRGGKWALYFLQGYLVLLLLVLALRFIFFR